jgi:hypothetical protein
MHSVCFLSNYYITYFCQCKECERLIKTGRLNTSRTMFGSYILDTIIINLYIFMLGTIAVILLVLWLLGVVTSYTLGGFIHVLLVIAIIPFVVRLIQGKPVA